MPARAVELRGHLIDSLLLAKALDGITAGGGTFRIDRVRIGRRPADPSRVVATVRAPTAARLEALVARLVRLGARPRPERDARLAPAPRDGVFPDGFYATTNLATRVRVDGRWLPVGALEMDGAIRVDPGRRAARVVLFHRVRAGDAIVVGSEGVAVTPLARARGPDAFRFMGSAVSSERPRAALVAAAARAMRATRGAGRGILVVAGPAVVHNGGAPDLAALLRAGWFRALFAGNGLATHDVEAALYGTALGAPVPGASRPPGPAADAHAHHLRAINAVRRWGSLAAGVRAGALRSGIMHACVTAGVPFVLAGSIRDDGPLPDVITDTLRAQDAMRRLVPGLGLALLVGTTLHAVATGNLLPASVRTICVDVNPAAVTKLADRGTFQGVGIVTDAASFLRDLRAALAGRRR